jgi:hypothetical protein
LRADAPLRCVHAREERAIFRWARVFFGWSHEKSTKQIVCCVKQEYQNFKGRPEHNDTPPKQLRKIVTNFCERCILTGQKYCGKESA